MTHGLPALPSSKLTRESILCVLMQEISVGTDRFAVAEVLFNPVILQRYGGQAASLEEAGVGGGPEALQGLHLLVNEVVNRWGGWVAWWGQGSSWQDSDAILLRLLLMLVLVSQVEGTIEGWRRGSGLDACAGGCPHSCSVPADCADYLASVGPSHGLLGHGLSLFPVLPLLTQVRRGRAAGAVWRRGAHGRHRGLRRTAGAAGEGAHRHCAADGQGQGRVWALDL